MSSPPQRDVIDYLDDNSQHEDETAFIPVHTNGFPDSWSGFWGGILLGIAGGGLVPLGPWLGGLLILAGYGMAASVLGSGRNRFANALRFGFVISAVLGLALVAGNAFVPKWTWAVVGFFGDRHLIFSGIAAMPWLAGLIRLLYRLIRPRKPRSAA